MPKNCISETSKISSRIVLRNPCTQVKFFFTARCTGDSEQSDIKTTEIASAVVPLLILTTFRTVLNQCAPAPRYSVTGQTSHRTLPAVTGDRQPTTSVPGYIWSKSEGTKSLTQMCPSVQCMYEPTPHRYFQNIPFRG